MQPQGLAKLLISPKICALTIC